MELKDYKQREQKLALRISYEQRVIIEQKISSKAFAIPILTASSKCLRANFCSIITLYS